MDLSVSQIYRIFRKFNSDKIGDICLDEFIDGIEDGFPDMNEKIDPGFLNEVFEYCSVQNPGGLNLKEFKLACKFLKHQSDSNTFNFICECNIRALRYGWKNGKIIYQEYVVSGSFPDIYSIGEMPCDFTDYIDENHTLKDKVLFKDIPEMVEKDSVLSKSTGNIVWWIDVSTNLNSSNKAAIKKYYKEYEKKFQEASYNFDDGIVTDHKEIPHPSLMADPWVLKLFGLGGSAKSNGSIHTGEKLNNSPGSRLSVGVGEKKDSLSLSAQTVFVNNTPLANKDLFEIPAWIDNLNPFSFCLNKSMNLDYLEALHRSHFYGNIKISPEVDAQFQDTEIELPKLIEIPDRKHLLDQHTMEVFRPELVRNTINIHLLGAKPEGGEYNTHGLITLRRIENENNDPKIPLLKLSNSGILGRIIMNLKKEILHIVKNKYGRKNFSMKSKKHFEKTEKHINTAGSLMTLLVYQINEFSFDSIGTFNYWLDVLDQKFNKHINNLNTLKKIILHINVAEKLIKEMYDYVDPFLSDLVRVQNYSEQISQGLGLVDKNKSKKYSNQDDDTSCQVMPLCSVCNSNPSKIIEIPLIPKISKDIREHLGEDLEKNLLDWKESLKTLTGKIESLNNSYRVKLDENRNYWSFLLTIFTIVLWPATFYTGYWGMNFDNMRELSAPYYDNGIEGVELVWVVLGVSYGFMVLLYFIMY